MSSHWITPVFGSIAELIVGGETDLNLLTVESLAEMDEALTALAGHAGLRALLVRGAGSRAFCAGADLKDLPRRSAAEQARFTALGQAVWSRLSDFPAPTLAVIQGPAFGAGMELALACDLRLAGPRARLGQPALRLGLIPPFAAAGRWRSLIGRGRANQILMLGKELDVVTAEAWGIIDGVSETLPETARAWAMRLSECAPAPVRAWRRWWDAPDPDAEAAYLTGRLSDAEPDQDWVRQAKKPAKSE